jgi:hypothetical protein
MFSLMVPALLSTRILLRNNVYVGRHTKEWNIWHHILWHLSCSKTWCLESCSAVGEKREGVRETDLRSASSLPLCPGLETVHFK